MSVSRRTPLSLNCRLGYTDARSWWRATAGASARVGEPERAQHIVVPELLRADSPRRAQAALAHPPGATSCTARGLRLGPLLVPALPACPSWRLVDAARRLGRVAPFACVPAPIAVSAISAADARTSALCSTCRLGATSTSDAEAFYHRCSLAQPRSLVASANCYHHHAIFRRHALRTTAARRLLS